ncbi:MAG: hypothetical protein JRG96_18995 [Deltaproteobacteria bacterium]|nr:hypothetical protein [Deltaproteobacteria bacterium]MBW2418540.1 hypothetical protein [Deltaproteobacteria bacterium]
MGRSEPPRDTGSSATRRRSRRWRTLSDIPSGAIDTRVNGWRGETVSIPGEISSLDPRFAEADRGISIEELWRDVTRA